MSESILKALMQLFAIIANVAADGLEKSRAVVGDYLKLQLNRQLTLEHLALFDQHVESLSQVRKTDKTGRKRMSSNSVKVLAICEQINQELQQSQKMLVLLQLLEFVAHNDEIGEKELDFVKTVSDIFNVSEAEFANLKAFVLDSLAQVPEKDKALVAADDTADWERMGVKTIAAKGMDGTLGILNVESTQMYFFRYKGKDELLLNGQLVQPDRTHLLDKGASIRSPKTKPLYYSDVVGKFLHGRSQSKIVFQAKDVEFRFKNSDNGIHTFNFREESGTLVGIMGGSGVGKSTLLNVLNGKLRPQKGSITINGYDIHSEKAHLEGVIGFVPQDDLLIEELSVYQNLYYNAKLCFRDMPEDKLVESVNKVLQDLGLFETKHLTVGNPLNKFISGGQRKRLNIALELIREPSVMFVDEPTSGLSSMDSEMVMDLLKEQTLKGRLVIVNIHQPSSDIYKLFDALLIMDKGGHPIFNGNPLDAVVYFKQRSHYVNADESQCPSCGNVNPEQVLQIVEAKVVDEYGRLTDERKVGVKEWFSLYREHVEPKLDATPAKETLPANQFKVPSRFKQFQIFSIRNILSKLANRQYMLINFLEAPLLALILGYFTKYIAGTPEDPTQYIFSQNENLPAYLFMSCVVSLFLGMTVSAEEIIKDRMILSRESFLNLSKWSYINSKVFILFIISAIQTLSFILVGNTILDIEGMTFNYWLLLFTASASANLLGLNISAALDSVVTIYILIPFILVPQLLLSGVIVKYDKLHPTTMNEQNHVPLVGDMMTLRWAYEALAVTQFRDNAFEREFYAFEKRKSDAAYVYNYWVSDLRTRIDFILKEKENPERAFEVNRDIAILRNEFAKIMAKDHGIRFDHQEQLSPSAFDAEIANAARKFLDDIKKHYNKLYADANRENDERIEQMIEELGGRDQFFEFKQANFNENLEDLMLNKQELKKIQVKGEQLVQMNDFIYQHTESAIGRAHFYAPSKQFLGIQVDTYWFNILFIWFTSLVFYVALVFDWLRKLVELGSRFNKKRR